MISIEDLLRFVREDAPWGDATSEAIVPDIVCRAVIRAKDSGTVAGLAEARALFEHFGVTVRERSVDGRAVAPGATLLELDGPAQAILLVERTALNIIGRMSGIATRTREAVDTVRAVSPEVRVAATRKTAPGLRVLDKKAVVLGGGDPHRWTLSDMVLIKDNHLALVPLPEAIRRAKQQSLYRLVEVEVETVEDAVTAAKADADLILLDNMRPDAVSEVVRVLAGRGLREGVTLEVSGGVAAGDLAGYAATGIDIISMGALTHTVRNFDVSLDILAGAGTVRIL
ncbi:MULTISPECIES: carboxylating nicotinate-nucleotide diphosphorylase [unclassified Methanoculleus]|uniref:carboxylating nicotinate-nucleotide diphosphorylase n=1 Tax=unclassified Methanoculleus TaxID=2619537 RepID=UPI0025E6BCE2|nr:MULTISPECIES: carboxylating nicotinate-nucleotide diphosphorylase [unclassified Methanoculleus]MCK9316977.1 carboxylating nicotinate-nucleotide diphosphorylase [Methanoculleus sp.]MDD2252852.1 carboxylating nicotinate-nucleotide diphosphorylase [Methanoculleus sp.]MDD2788903.1 carboxylating nicotinate-nucleotide diphosphorylase [Methanoculleus sp.]MDD3215731.1 carboxylating nicotinate-nucleotide diphosphorylase [Methanoculleus sp.]MDD4313510.1 carboxylating nicotinate-nucleotide diphosphory